MDTTYEPSPAAIRELEPGGAVLVQPPELQIVSLADVPAEPVQWLWEEMIPIGKVTVVHGDACVGKTCWALDLAARVSAGIMWPTFLRIPGPAPVAGKVLILNGEDHLSNKMVPRLMKSGANMRNVAAVPGLKSNSADGERAFDLEQVIPNLKKQIETLGNVRLVIIDPLEVYCAAGPKTQRMRLVMAALGKLAEDCGIALVVISARKKCELPGQHMWRIDCEMCDPGQRWFVPIRCGCARLPLAMAFQITDQGFNWDGRNVKLDLDQVRGSSAQEHRTALLRAVAAFLTNFLSNGARSAREVFREGQRAGWSKAQLYRAKTAMRVVSYKVGEFKGRWMWELSELTFVGGLPDCFKAKPPARPPVPPTPPVPATPPVPPAAPVLGGPEPHDKFLERLLKMSAGQSPVTAAPGQDESELASPFPTELLERMIRWDQELERRMGPAKPKDVKDCA